MTDDELMAAVCAGDEQAYRTIVRRHLSAIGHYAFRLTGDRADAEDIAQETFLRLWTQAGRWDSTRARLTTWLHRICHNLCIDHLRKHGRSRTEPETEVARQASETETVADDSAETEQREDRMRRLQSCLSRLPEAQRSAVMLCHHSGFSNREAAAIMNLSVKALESTLTRARGNLRDMLGGD